MLFLWWNFILRRKLASFLDLFQVKMRKNMALLIHKFLPWSFAIMPYQMHFILSSKTKQNKHTKKKNNTSEQKEDINLLGIHTLYQVTWGWGRPVILHENLPVWPSRTTTLLGFVANLGGLSPQMLGLCSTGGTVSLPLKRESKSWCYRRTSRSHPG